MSYKVGWLLDQRLREAMSTGKVVPTRGGNDKMAQADAGNAKSTPATEPSSGNASTEKPSVDWSLTRF
jgi:hypothetical protein